MQLCRAVDGWKWLLAALACVAIVMTASSTDSTAATVMPPRGGGSSILTVVEAGNRSANAGAVITFLRTAAVGPSDLTVPKLAHVAPITSVTTSDFGLVARFQRSAGPLRTSPSVPRVVVEMSGHMRTYQRCATSVRQHLLGPNQATLVIATYPDVGNKRYGVRDFSRDAEVDVAALRDLYGAAHLDTVHLLDYPTVALSVRRAVRTADHHFSWVLYQLIAMELAHNLTLHMPDVDVAVRLRPDLHIMGPVLLRHADAGLFSWSYECGGGSVAGGPAVRFNVTFGGTKLLQAPHHPRLQWGPIAGADHSLIGVPAAMQRFAGSFFSRLAAMPPEDLNATYFHRGSYAEKMWITFAKQSHVELQVVAGWHVVLRDPEAYRNSTVSDERSKKRKAMLDAIFAIVDPALVPCPRPSGLTSTTLDGSKGPKKRH